MRLPGPLLLVSGLGCQQGAPQHLLRLPQELHVLLDATAAATPEVQPEPVLLGVGAGGWRHLGGRRLPASARLAEDEEEISALEVSMSTNPQVSNRLMTRTRLHYLGSGIGTGLIRIQKMLRNMAHTID